jgi:hypothetical protein
MSATSMYFAKRGAKFASSASEKFLRKCLGCFMLISVPFVLAKTSWWQATISQITASSQKHAAEDESASSIIAKTGALFIDAKRKLESNFRTQLERSYEDVGSRLPLIPAAVQHASATIEHFRTGTLEMMLIAQRKLENASPGASAAVTSFLSSAGLSGQDSLQHGFAYMVLGAAGGFLSGMLGVGGGVVITPCLAAFSSMPHVTVIGTAILTMIPATIIGTLQHHAARNVLWPQAAALAGGSLLGATAGSNVALMVSDDGLRCVFAVMMSIFGARTLAR